MKARFSVWLLADAPTRRALRPLLRRTDGEGDPVPIGAHLTLLSSEGEIGPAMTRALERAASRTRPLRVGVRGVQTGAAWSRSVFLRVGGAVELTALRRRLRRGSVAGAKAPPFPHVSLVYGVASRAARQALARRLRSGRIPPSVAFDTLVLVRTGRAEGDSHDVRAWRLVHRVRLSEGPKGSLSKGRSGRARRRTPARPRRR